MCRNNFRRAAPTKPLQVLMIRSPTQSNSFHQWTWAWDHACCSLYKPTRGQGQLREAALRLRKGLQTRVKCLLRPRRRRNVLQPRCEASFNPMHCLEFSLLDVSLEVSKVCEQKLLLHWVCCVLLRVELLASLFQLRYLCLCKTHMGISYQQCLRFQYVLSSTYYYSLNTRLIFRTSTSRPVGITLVCLPLAAA